MHNIFWDLWPDAMWPWIWTHRKQKLTSTTPDSIPSIEIHVSPSGGQEGILCSLQPEVLKTVNNKRFTPTIKYSYVTTCYNKVL